MNCCGKSEKGEMDTPRKTFCVWPLTDIFVSDEDDYDKNVAGPTLFINFRNPA